MAREQTITKLSKSILEMKFMKKTKEKVEQEFEDAEGREMYSHEITEEMRKGAGCFIVEPSFVPCEDLLVGRLSFRGMNPEIERLMELENEEHERLLNAQKETEVSDKEMAAYYNPLVKSMNRKFKISNTNETQRPSKYERKHKRSNSPGTPKPYKKTKFDKRSNEENDSYQNKNKRTKFMKPSDEDMGNNEA